MVDFPQVVANQTGANTGSAVDAAEAVAAATTDTNPATEPGKLTPVLGTRMTGRQMLIGAAIIGAAVWWIWYRKK